MFLWVIAGILMLLAFITPDGRVIILRALKVICIIGVAIFCLFRFMDWWMYDPSSPGCSQDAVNQVHEMERVDEKRKSCEDIAPADWDEECRHLTMGND